MIVSSYYLLTVYCKMNKLVYLTFKCFKNGFIKAEGLFVGDKLISVDGKDLIVETHDIEQCEKPITVRCV